MRWPWSPAPFIPDEGPLDERGWGRSLLWLMLGCLLAGGLTLFTLLQLDGHGDQLRLHLQPRDTAILTAQVVATQEAPARLTYRFSYPPTAGPEFTKTVGVPRDVAHRLRPGAKLDVVCLRSNPGISAPRGQAAIGTRFYLAAGLLFAMYLGVLGGVRMLWLAGLHLARFFGLTRRQLRT